MFRRLIFLTIIEFLILDQTSYVLSRQLNFTQLKNLFKPEVYHHETLREIPVEREVSYLSDETYDLENWNKLKQPIRRSKESNVHKYQHLCKTYRTLVEMRDNVYEYQPSYYHEIHCKTSYEDDNEQDQQKCAYPESRCVQKTEPISFVRRPWGSTGCWELYSIHAATGCDCMLPVTLDNLINNL